MVPPRGGQIRFRIVFVTASGKARRPMIVGISELATCKYNWPNTSVVVCAFGGHALWARYGFQSTRWKFPDPYFPVFKSALRFPKTPPIACRNGNTRWLKILRRDCAHRGPR